MLSKDFKKKESDLTYHSTTQLINRLKDKYKDTATHGSPGGQELMSGSFSNFQEPVTLKPSASTTHHNGFMQVKNYRTIKQHTDRMHLRQRRFI